MSRGSGLRQLAFGVAGSLLVLAGVGLVAMTEQAAIQHRVAADRHGGQVLDIAPDSQPEAGQHGYMVRVSSAINVVEAPHDAEFNQHVKTPVLIRHVEMFQWREVRIGSEVHYEQDWVDRPLDANRFEHPAGHANPGAFPVKGKQFDAGLTKVGGFALSPVLLHALPGSDRIEPDTKSLPTNLAASFSRHGDYLSTSANPNHPRLGDLRVSWEAVPLQVVTVFARLDGDQLVPASEAADGKGYDVQVGDRRLVDVLPDVPEPPVFAMPRRVLAVLLATLGALLLLRDRLPMPGAAPISLGAGLLLIGAVAGVMWLGNDLQASAYWFVLAVLGLAVAVWRLHARTE
ncbi:TMEM43 family protein [Dyella subtropica]|uniref:TMEM43 family protein n=1 Tax=Dyella subtropica TaxID=2992127 RepID=UPI00225802D5|nr:TMEM43 family protein [Dyella subtropica]